MDDVLARFRQAADHESGDVYTFVSRDRVRAKVLRLDGTGLCTYTKRLERGRFAHLWRDDGDTPLTLTISELDLFLDGSTQVGRYVVAVLGGGRWT